MSSIFFTAGDRLASGAEQLASAAENLGNGLSRLSGGTLALVGGLDDLSEGAEALQDGLLTGVEESAPLESGLEDASVQVLDGRQRIRRQVGQVATGSPGLFNSGYFVLSALEGTPPRAREAISETIDLPRGGQAATMLVISDYSFNTPGFSQRRLATRDLFWLGWSVEPA
ncbi:hypothetical protein [Klebsiella pneumoniae]|uniref:hypothetical protein n=1 Tax=Klebsiella pneumoniae TaxID=573 RepID=UPI003A80C766